MIIDGLGNTSTRHLLPDLSAKKIGGSAIFCSGNLRPSGLPADRQAGYEIKLTFFGVFPNGPQCSISIYTAHSYRNIGFHAVTPCFGLLCMNWVPSGYQNGRILGLQFIQIF